MPKKVIQTGMDEQPLEEPAIEVMLDDRERTRLERLPYDAAFKAADKAAKDALDDLELELGLVYRIGAWRVEKAHTEGKLVSFERGDKDRITIAPAASPE